MKQENIILRLPVACYFYTLLYIAMVFQYVYSIVFRCRSILLYTNEYAYENVYLTNKARDSFFFFFVSLGGKCLQLDIPVIFFENQTAHPSPVHRRNNLLFQWVLKLHRLAESESFEHWHCPTVKYAPKIHKYFVCLLVYKYHFMRSKTCCSRLM